MKLNWLNKLINFLTVSSCGAELVGPSGSFSSPNNPNSYPDNAYCRWKISVPAGKKVMVTFNSLKTQKNKDLVEIYDGGSKALITKLSGVYSKPVSFTSESTSIDIRFVSDGSENSAGFSASFQQVSKYLILHQMCCNDRFLQEKIICHNSFSSSVLKSFISHKITFQAI